MVIYVTNEWKGYGKQNYYHNEYHLEGNSIVQYKCNRRKSFDGNESSWIEDERRIRSWNIDDSDLPEWLGKRLLEKGGKAELSSEKKKA